MVKELLESLLQEVVVAMKVPAKSVSLEESLLVSLVGYSEA